MFVAVAFRTADTRNVASTYDVIAFFGRFGLGKVVPLLAEVVEPKRQGAVVEFEGKSHYNAALYLYYLIFAESAVAVA